MFIRQPAHRANRGVAALAASMLISGGAATAQSTVTQQVAEADSTILVIGRGKEVDLATMRGPVIDLPQAINQIDGVVLRDRQVTTLAEALPNVAGVTTTVGEGGVVNGDQFFIRGQAARDDIFTDGLRDFGAFTRDSFNYESVQVLKGSSSTALGRGTSGGAINTQSKRASADQFITASLGGGTADYRRFSLDANTGLGDTGGLRMNVMAHQNDTPDRDNVMSKRWGIAPTIRLGIGTDTHFDLVFLHQEEDRVIDYGVPIAVTTLLTDIERPVTEFGVPRSNFYGFAGDLDQTGINTLTARFDHIFSDILRLTSDAKLGVYDRAFRQTVPSCAAATCGNLLRDTNPTTIPLSASAVRGQFRQTTRGLQNVSTLLLERPLGEMRNALIVGWDVSYQTNDREDDIRPNNGATSSVTQGLFDPRGNAPLNFSRKVYQYRDSRATDVSLFIDERLWVLPNLSFNVGLRFQHFDTHQETLALSTNASGPITTCNAVAGTFASCLTLENLDHDLWSPKASLIWEPSTAISVYATFSKAAVPPGNSLSNGSLNSPGTGATISSSDLAPETTKTFDLGAKFSLFGDRLLIQSAIYRIDRSNAREVDPATNLFVASGDPRQRLRGFEFGASGTITPDILVTFNYAYVDAEILEAYTSGVLDTAAIGKQVRYIPEHALSVWGSYKPRDGALAGFEIGAGASHQSQVYLNNTNTQVTPAYVAFDALLGYNFGRVRLAVNGYNLTDRLYYSQVNGGRVVPAAGRSFVASLSLSF